MGSAIPGSMDAVAYVSSSGLGTKLSEFNEWETPKKSRVFWAWSLGGEEVNTTWTLKEQ